MPPPTPTRAQLGRVVRRHRKARGLTIGRLAKLAKMDETYASGIERGRRNPSWEKLLALANVLDVPLSKIILESEQEAEDEQGSGPQP